MISFEPDKNKKYVRAHQLYQFTILQKVQNNINDIQLRIKGDLQILGLMPTSISASEISLCSMIQLYRTKSSLKCIRGDSITTANID